MRLPILILSGIVLLVAACKKEESCPTKTITRQCINYNLYPQVRYNEHINSVIVRKYEVSSGFTVLLKDTAMALKNNESPAVSNIIDMPVNTGYNYEFILLPVNDTFRISGLEYEQLSEQSWENCRGAQPQPCSNPVKSCIVTRNGQTVAFEEDGYQYGFTTILFRE